jgi:uncharacterized protein (TIGR02270 family)
MWNATIIPTVVQQHAEEVAVLWQLRTAGTKQPNFAVMYLERFDRRVDAHLDALAVAGGEGWRFLEAALENPSPGAVFTAAERAIQDRDQERLDRLFALTAAVPDSCSGLLSAFGWLSGERLQGVVVRLVASTEPFRRMVGVAACAMHRVDPGLLSSGLTHLSDPLPRARSLRAAGELGLVESTSNITAAMKDEHPDCQFWAAWSSVLLGNRGIAVERLTDAGLAEGPHRRRAFVLALQAMKAGAAHSLLKELAADPQQLRWLIQGSGIAGDPTYVPWLINHMSEPKTVRLAGEAFTLITGADLSALRLDCQPPENFESGPTDNPEDENVDMDPDEGLPWPDPEKIEKWWAANSSRFHKGTRYFMGAPVTREHCIDVLKNGYQRQRILAAHYLCLLEPGTPLFNTSAPAWRQQRLLARM